MSTLLGDWRNWVAVKQRPIRPDHRALQCSNAAFLQRGKTGVKLRVKQPPCQFVARFQMPSIRSSNITRRLIPRDAERPIVGSQRGQQSKFQHVADVAGILIEYSFSLPWIAVFQA